MRGKHGKSAAVRREATEVEQNEAAYRRRILKLTEERDAVRAELDKARADWAKEVRILRAQLAEGMSPRVEALTRQLNGVREDRDRLRRALKVRDEDVARFGARLADHFAGVHGVTHRSKEMYDVLAEFLPVFEHGLGKVAR